MPRNPHAIAKALLRAQPTGTQPGSVGFGGPPSTIGAPGPSPLVASYGDWSTGRNLGRGLPRDWNVFQSGTFGPLAPMLPIPIDSPEPGEDQAPPRRWQYPVSWNIPHGMPGDEGLKVATFQQLRTIGQTYSVARACIQLRQNEILGLGWDITPTKAAEKAMRTDTAARKDFETRRAKALKFFRRPDPDYFAFRDWFRVLLEDVLVIDALSIYMWPARQRGKGVLGSDLGALAAIDGSTIRPLLDIHGGKPAAPNPAYQAYQFGVPRVDLMRVLTEDDLDGLSDVKVREYRGDQFIYRPQYPADNTPYGFAPLEQALVPVISGLQRQQWQLEFFSEGSVPALFVTNGDKESTPNQNRELQDALNAMAGDPAWKHKIIVLPGGSQTMPQRPAELAGQFDELIMTQVCMAFSVMPMELGITPRSSSSGHSGGAANQMGKLSTDAQDRKANLPMLEWFGDIFNHVLQNVLGQADMQWYWEGLEADEDEQTKTDIQVKMISTGLMSVDEARVENGQQAWGLPLTSEPVLVTPTGVIPFGSIDPDTGQPQGLTPKLTATPTPPTAPGTAPGEDGPPESPDDGGTQPAKPPTGPKPAGGPASTAPATPAHAGARQQAATTAAITKPTGGGTPAPVKPAAPVKAEKTVHVHAALRELDLIRRRLTKGRSIADWTPEHIPTDVFEALTADLLSGPTADSAAEKARTAVKALAGRQERDQAITGPMSAVVDGLRTLAEQFGAGTLSSPQFVDRGVAVLRTGIRAGLAAGVDHARAAVTKAAVPDGRLNLYAGQVVAAYGQGHALATLGAADDPDNIAVRWHARPGACELCKARDGQLFTVATLPGFPGDGGFGADATVCLGGPNCRCRLAYETIHPDQAAQLADHPTPTSDTVAAQVAADGGQRVRDVAAVRAALTGPAATLDAVLDTIADRQAEQQRPYLLGLLGDIYTGLSDAGMPMPVSMARPDRGHSSSHWLSGAVLATIVAAAIAAALARQQQSQQQAAPATQAAVTKAASGADAEHVMSNLLTNYPVSALGWVWDAKWTGPVLVPTDQVDTDDEQSWAASHQPARVKHFTRALKRGEPVRPAVCVREPGEPKVKIIDGHHRYLAARKAGKPLRCYVGQVDQCGGPWDETHTAQTHHGADPANKGGKGGPKAAGLVVRADDTGRVLMLQRAYTDDDDAAGRWEFPGGKLDNGETPRDAAVREWSEETGIPVPDGKPVGGWTSGNGVYQGFVWAIPHETDVPIFDGRGEVTNPDDPDGDQVEALAWFDPDHLRDNPAVRDELSQDINTVLDAIEKTLTPGLMKVAEGPVGDYRARHLHHYWTRGEGLAQWVDSPHPWTTLYHHLLEYIHDPDEAKRTASQWFRDVTGMWSGERRGKNPAGRG